MLFRSYYIAQSYLVAKKWTEAIALYEKCLSYAQNSKESYQKLSESVMVLYEVSQVT